jgi:hypothetical protein
MAYNHIFYAIKRKDKLNKKDIYVCFCQNYDTVRNCGSGPYFKVRVNEVKKGEISNYWCWRNLQEECYQLISPEKERAKQKINDYLRPDERKKNMGKLVNLSIEEICEIK